MNEGFADLGEHVLKNIARPVRAYRLTLDQERHGIGTARTIGARRRPGAPDKPSIAALPFQNMSGDCARGLPDTGHRQRGGLLSYGGNFRDIFYRSARYVDSVVTAAAFSIAVGSGVRVSWDAWLRMREAYSKLVR